MVTEKNIFNGDNRLIYSRRIVLASDEPTTFELVLEDGALVNLIFVFNKTEDNKPAFTVEDSTMIGGFSFKIILTNFNNSFGIGLIDPIVILEKTDNKTQQKTKTKLTLYAYKNEDAHHILDIALYEGK